MIKGTVVRQHKGTTSYHSASKSSCFFENYVLPVGVVIFVVTLVLIGTGVI